MSQQSGVRQIYWTAWRYDVSWSYRPSALYHRFSVVRTTDGYTVTDHELKGAARVRSLAAAHAWAGVRVG